MPAKRKAASPKETSTATIGFEAKLWLAADSRSAAETAEGNQSNNMDAAEYPLQESNATTRCLAIMNLAIRGIEADIGKEHADTFRSVQHPDLRADYVLANPPFNDSDWFRKDDDIRWQFGVPPNLTLLTQPLNSSVSNSAFLIKKPEILKNSALALNRYFHDKESWDESSIATRGDVLFVHAAAKWPYPAPVVA